ncbi:aldo/keto reductase [Fibrella arboris]|uniref:aldo/keto reductase n=1 Tax=Fibrella arboris TaxID=3242486 RepID=UPI003521CB11
MSDAITEPIARLGIGTWQLGGPNYVGDKPTGWGAVDTGAAIRAVHRAIDEGVRFIDTADSYGAGQAETLVGEALAQVTYPGTSSVEICTKFGNRRDAAGQPTQEYSPAYLTEAVDASLRRLQRDVLDVLLLHSPPDAFDWTTYDPEPFDALVRAGKIKAYGVSSRSVYGAKRVMDAGFGSVLEVIYNALDRRAETVLWTDPASASYRFIARVPLASGFLKATYLAEDPVFPADQYRHYLPDRDRQWLLDSVRQVAFLDELEGGISASALRFCLSHPAVSVVIPGIRSEEQVIRHVQAAKLGPLPNETRQQINVAVPDVPSHWKPA